MLLLLLAPFLSGCLGGASTLEALDAPRDAERERSEFLANHPTFCFLQSTCNYWDDMYHERVVYDLDTTVLDIVIVPPVNAPNDQTGAASRLAVQAWMDGIRALGASWLADNLTMNIYVVGEDIPSVDAIPDPEIIVTSASLTLTNGIGLEPVQAGCYELGQLVDQELGGHEHNGNRIFAQRCAETKFTCFAINVGEPENIAMQDLIAHEVGHCLGIGHVGDARDFKARYAPIADIMSYQNNPEHVHCVSNLNVRTLEGVYAHLLGRPESEWMPAHTYLDMDPLEYDAGQCDNAPGA